MPNMMQAARQQVSALTQAAYEKAAAAGLLPGGVTVSAKVDVPKDPAHGDFASSFAMAGAKAMGRKPRDIAQAVLDNLELEGTYFEKAEIAGPGFLNFFLGERWYGQVLAAIEAEGPAYGQGTEGAGQRVMVEFVSANPTGPMHMGNARGGVLGDSLASVLERDGFEVWREFYVNDAGNQIHKFAMSIDARYLQLVLGEENVPFPEDGYHGEDIKELARAFLDKHGADWAQRGEEERREMHGPVRPEREHPPHAGRPAPLPDRVRPVVLGVHPPRERLRGRDGGAARREGLDLREGRGPVAEHHRPAQGEVPGRRARARSRWTSWT